MEPAPSKGVSGGVLGGADDMRNGHEGLWCGLSWSATGGEIPIQTPEGKSVGGERDPYSQRMKVWQRVLF